MLQAQFRVKGIGLQSWKRTPAFEGLAIRVHKIHQSSCALPTCLLSPLHSLDPLWIIQVAPCLWNTESLRACPDTSPLWVDLDPSSEWELLLWAHVIWLRQSTLTNPEKKWAFSSFCFSMCNCFFFQESLYAYKPHAHSGPHILILHRRLARSRLPHDAASTGGGTESLPEQRMVYLTWT